MPNENMNIMNTNAFQPMRSGAVRVAKTLGNVCIIFHFHLNSCFIMMVKLRKHTRTLDKIPHV